MTSPVDKANFAYRWANVKDARPAARIEGVTWHTLRHTFISRLVMAGIDLRTVMELPGHKTIQMTMRYAHLAPGHAEKAIEKLCHTTATTTATEDSGAIEKVAPTVQ